MNHGSSLVRGVDRNIIRTVKLAEFRCRTVTQVVNFIPKRSLKSLKFSRDRQFLNTGIAGEMFCRVQTLVRMRPFLRCFLPALAD